MPWQLLHDGAALHQPSHRALYEAEHSLLNAHRWPNRTRERGMDSWCLAFIGCVKSRAARGDDSNSDGNNFNGDERLLQQQQYNGGLCAVSHFHYTDINKQAVLTAVYLIII